MVETMGGHDHLARTFGGRALRAMSGTSSIVRIGTWRMRFSNLTGPRSYVTMESEIYSRIRAYSPEHRYWSVTNGEFKYGEDESLANAMEARAIQYLPPRSIYRTRR